jgi:hypothetical protein
MGKHNESVNRSGTCLTPGCGKSRDAGNWYCAGCNRDFRAEQDQRRGTIGSYPAATAHDRPAAKEKDKPAIEIYQPDRDWGMDRGIDWGPQARKVDARPSCDNGGQGHDGKKPFYTLPGGKILYGARGSNLAHANLEHLDLIIDCAGVVAESGRFVKSAPARYRGLKAGLLPDVIRLDWPDMSAPVHVGIRWWMRLLELLPAHTCVCCVGGHGRTGTALASLLVASGMDAETAIRTVREQHCRRAIETQGQEAYVKALGKAKAAIDAAVMTTAVKAEGV